MAKKSLFSRIAESFQSDEERDLDKELEDAVSSIWEEEVDELDAQDVLTGSWGDAGDMVYIMALNPLYKAIGGSKGRMADSLREHCGRIFSNKISPDRGKAKLDGHNFVMRIYEPEETAFNIAGAIVNAIGTYILSDRFKTMDVPDLMIAAELGDITNDDGSIDTQKVKEAVESGGRPVKMKKPGDNAPGWFRLLWDSNKALVAKFAESQDRDKYDPNWQASSKEREEVDAEWKALDHGKKEMQERGPDRRQNKQKISRLKERRTSWRPRRMEDSMRM